MAVTRRKLKSGFAYIVQVRDPQGGWYPSKQFSRKEDAKVYEGSLLAQKAKGQTAIQTEFRGVTLSEYYHQTWKIQGRPKVNEGWRSEQDRMFKNHIEPYLGKAVLVEIQKRDIAKLLAELREVKGLAPGMVRHIYILLHSIFEYAVDISEVRDFNPVIKKFKPTVQKKVPTYLGPDLARQFLETVSDHWLGPSIWIMVGTGLRVCELIGLQHGDLDLVTRKLTLRRQWNRKGKKISPVKNKRAETPIPIASDLAEYLQRKLSPLARPTDWVVQRCQQPGEMASYHTIQKALKALCAKHNFPLLTPHGLRHTTSGLWKEAGAHRSDLRELYNHSDDATTRIYDHEVPERLDNIGTLVGLTKKRSHLKLIQTVD